MSWHWGGEWEYTEGDGRWKLKWKRCEYCIHVGYFPKIKLKKQKQKQTNKNLENQTYSKFEEVSSSGVVSSSDWSLKRSHVWIDDESATSKTGAILGLLNSLFPSEGRVRVGPLAALQLVSCKSIATVPKTIKQKDPLGHFYYLCHNNHLVVKINEMLSHY